MNEESNNERILLTSMASAMFFGTIIFASVACSVKMALSGDWGSLFQTMNNSRASPLDSKSFSSIATLLYHCSVLGLLLFYAYICENHPPYPHGVKTYDRDEFFFMTAIVLVASCFTLKGNGGAKSPSTSKKDANDAVVTVEILHRDQTEEWKGWMQLMFLLYHYYNAEEVYNSIRVMITCYVFMTGFGNLSFFYIKGDYSLVRVLQMLWRLNFLVLCLCLTQGTTYILYYICLLHTYFFGMVYVTMRVASSVNYAKWGIRLKMAVLAVIIFLVWDVDSGLFRLVHFLFLDETPTLGATNGAMWEWYFRSALDHWSAFLGMLFALNLPVTNLLMQKIEASSTFQHFLTKSLIGSILLAATWIWVSGPFLLEKVDYNLTHPYFSCVPVLCYIYFRNISPWLRTHSLHLLHQIGKTTLETYLMQHHIWLTSNAKSLLILIPGWPKINFLAVTVVYLIVSRRLYQLTLFLRGMILPNDRMACIRHTATMVGIILGYLLLALFLQRLSLDSLWSVFFVSATAGMRLFLKALEHSSSQNRSMGNCRFAGSAGLCTLLLIGFVWNHASEIGASKNQPLTAACSQHIQEGVWIPAACSEDFRGAGYRKYGSFAYGTCSTTPSGSLVWGWNKTASTSHCRPSERDSKTLLRSLAYRNVTFVGDSIVRHLYHSMCRQVGDTDAGAYNTSLGKWADYSRHYGYVDLEFRWAPYVDQMGLVLNRIQSDVHPDVVVVGGGPWDKLHRYNSTEDRTLVDANITILKDQMEALRDAKISVVWVVPTTMNSWGLMTPQKREAIREEQIDWFRQHFREKGINAAASFVLDGQSFTKERVGESYDGVHYPLSVYDAGAQVLANAFDWLLPDREFKGNLEIPSPGEMAQPFLGSCILILVMIGLISFDGFLGVSYVVALISPRMMPSRLFDEAFAAVHRIHKLPRSEFAGGSARSSPKSKDSDVESSSVHDNNEVEMLMAPSPEITIEGEPQVQVI